MSQQVPNLGIIDATELHDTLRNIVCENFSDKPTPTNRSEHLNAIDTLYELFSPAESDSVRIEKKYGWVDIFDKKNDVHEPNFPSYVPIVNGYGAHVFLTLWINEIPWVIDPKTPHPDYGNDFLVLCVSKQALYYEEHPTADVTHPYTSD